MLCGIWWSHGGLLLLYLQKAFKGLTQTAAFMSKALFKFVCGAATVWEVHSAGLQRTAQQLQNYLEEVNKHYEEKNQVGIITCGFRWRSVKFM